MAPRRGPRPHGDARADILTTARAHFAELGYDRTSLRGIARAAGVDPALVHHYFDGKPALFAATMDLAVDPGEVIARVVDGPADEVGERVVRAFLGLWDSDAMAGRPRALVSALVSAGAGPAAFAPIRGFLMAEVLGRLTHSLGIDEPERRAGLVGSQLVGLLLMRYVVELPGVAGAPVERIVADVAPTIQRYLTGALDPDDVPPPGPTGSTDG